MYICRISLTELISSGADGLPSERGNEGRDIPIQTDRYLDERDISSKLYAGDIIFYGFIISGCYLWC